jgi:predicted Fe-S protein YdhL (DUF1289 family)
MLSQFQKQFIRTIAAQPDFSHFCLGWGKTADEFIEWLEEDSTKGPLVLAACAPDFQVHRVGQKRVLQSVHP